MARSRTIEGPYELHPNTHLITSKDEPDAVLQRSGHGQYVETPDGQFYHTHLCSRPLAPHRRSPLGRETGLQKCVWRDDWLYLDQGGVVPDVDVPAPANAETVVKPARTDYRFDGKTLPADFQWLRTPEPQRIFSLTDRPGHLRLTGRESIGSWFEQALVARRQEHHRLRAETVVETFDPDTYQQACGLTHYYNRHKFHALVVTLHEKLGRVVTIFSCPGDFPNSRMVFPAGSGVSIPDGPLELAMDVQDNDLQFFWRPGGSNDWEAIGPVLDASVISDEGGRGEHASFTGAFVGMFAFDTSGRAKPADFSRFAYEVIPE
jgi:xylan 1,4-beta-xylosidase